MATLVENHAILIHVSYNHKIYSVVLNTMSFYPVNVVGKITDVKNLIEEKFNDGHLDEHFIQLKFEQSV